MAISLDEVEARARQIRLLLLDVDGVLTDGLIVLAADGDEAKSFSIRDGAALVWAKRAGLQVGFLSGRPSEATSRRARELGIDLVVQEGPDKGPAFARILEQHGLVDEQVAYMGDDLLDLPVLRRAGLSAAPADAAPEVLARVHWVSRKPGGRGAVRELVELLLHARQEWDALLNRYLG